MELNGFWPVFGVACLGGALLELYKWYRLRESERFPRYASSPAYWALTFLMILAGGVVATLYGTDQVQPALALNIGVATPAIIRALSGKVPEEIAAPQDESRQRGRRDPGTAGRHGSAWTRVRVFMAGA